MVTLVVLFTVMWRLDSSLALLAIVLTPILGILIRVFDRPMTENTYRQQQLEGEMMALAEQTLTALPAVQAFGREERNDTDFRLLSQRTLQAYLRAIRSQLQFKVGVSAVSAAGTALVILMGGFHVMAGALTLGSLLVFLSYLASLYVPIETLAYSSAGFAAAAAGARRVLEVLDSEEMVKEAPDAAALPMVRGHVRFEEVTVGYEPGRPVLHEISLEAHPGETVALVGPTGAGKSTLVSLIPRFFDPWSGLVLIDGHDVRTVQLKSLRAQIALVLQEPFLLPLSAAENIAYGRPGATREEVEAAARAANAHEFIARLPEGYDTVLGERGATLSGGERQRLSIARALLKDAPILILDEPTSALDAGTESLLLEALERLMSGRTTFIIAHRLSTIRGADRIVVIENGRAVEQGTHQELIVAGGMYQRFHELQYNLPAGVAR
jgi:ATP-binding cassette subfamily B protein/subfamily B ATP-binding cassette protein MsbA